MMQLNLHVLDGEFIIYRLAADAAIPDRVLNGRFLSITRTDDELSIVCASDIVIEAEQAEAGWSCLKVAGLLDFSLTGILANLAMLLADAEISIFAISTYDTDYIMVKAVQLQDAIAALQQGGHAVV